MLDNNKGKMRKVSSACIFNTTTKHIYAKFVADQVCLANLIFILGRPYSLQHKPKISPPPLERLINFQSLPA